MEMKEKIKERRRELGLTQEQVASYLNVSAPAVNKWERGVSYPDVGTLPSLARLLKIDLNELFCFRENLTDQEIGLFVNEVSETARTEGIETAFSRAEEKIREYPGCCKLIYALAAVLDGAALLCCQEEEKASSYQDKLELWYERAAESGEEAVRNRALYMLAGRCLRRGKLERGEELLERAEELLERIPAQDQLDKTLLLANVYRRQGKEDKAEELLQNRLLLAVNEIQSLLLFLSDLASEAGLHERAGKLAEAAAASAELFELWEYNRYLAPLQAALAKKDKKESIRLLNQLLRTVEVPWNLKDSVFYDRISAKDSSGMGEKMMPVLLRSLENSPEYEFLREEEGFRELLKIRK